MNEILDSLERMAMILNRDGTLPGRVNWDLWLMVAHAHNTACRVQEGLNE